MKRSPSIHCSWEDWGFELTPSFSFSLFFSALSLPLLPSSALLISLRYGSQRHPLPAALPPANHLPPVSLLATSPAPAHILLFIPLLLLFIPLLLLLFIPLLFILPSPCTAWLFVTHATLHGLTTRGRSTPLQGGDSRTLRARQGLLQCYELVASCTAGLAGCYSLLTPVDVINFY